MFRSYTQLLARRPLLTQVATAGFISAAGDVVAQLGIEHRKMKEFDRRRTGRFFFLTGCIVTPVLHRWFRVLEKIRSGPPLIVPLKRLAVDQIAFGPGFSAICLTVLRMLEGYSIGNSIYQTKRDFWHIWVTSLAVWPLAQVINFYLVPLQYRIIFVQFIALFWNSYLSFATQEKLPHSQDLPHIHEADY